MRDRTPFGRTGLSVTPIAFGGIPVMRLSRSEGVKLVRDVIELGINFIDTARMYGDSEEKIGEAVRDVPRESLVIASKSTARERDGFLGEIDKSLSLLQTDYIDIYQMHNVSTEEAVAAVMGPGGACEGLVQAVLDGRVRHPGFSSHNLPITKKLMLTDKFSVVQVPFNFVDEDAKEEIIPLARRMNVGLIAMKPLGGGLLDDANLCFRYLMQFEGIVPDPGIERIEEMREIISIVEDPRPLTDNELARMDRIRRDVGSSWCHRCDYCQPCPQDIPISLLMVSESMVKRMSYDTTVELLTPVMEKASTCTECGACAERCPYELKIPDLLKTYRAAWDRYLETKKWAV
jgi:predicted aldo/keto reductase-like oxidoreductase